MAVSGTLAVKVHRIEASLGERGGQEGQETPTKYSVKIAVGVDEHRTQFTPVNHEIDETLHYSVQDTAESEDVTIEVLHEDQTKPVVSTRQKLRDFLEGFKERKMNITFGTKQAPSTMQLHFSAEWTPQQEQQDQALATAETHRPWFMRASYYYETSKIVYDYTTSFRVVAPFARLGEATVNTVVSTVSGYTLHDVDQSLVVPVLDSVDNKVDATISVAFTKLYEGQKMAVKTKDKAVNVVSSVATKTTETVSTAVASSAQTAGRATRYTTGKVAEASSKVYGTVAGVADYAGNQVVHASSSTYGMMRGVTCACTAETSFAVDGNTSRLTLADLEEADK
ncbi:hypothetical protein BBJ29_006560 [Phytophthora kernoviae]|uniref:Senescence domain-containing protein n=1 Tax=Phytophthora kernoviae TaxID=325452 RepID=A0A3F2RE72_9STRA|nr:hypothetical protein BBJ29_006560 [Phytophthora kernoviae]RLN54574.1 hypothetical protein BBP00_00008885 [Phytophthora kernoviae]